MKVETLPHALRLDLFKKELFLFGAVQLLALIASPRIKTQNVHNPFQPSVVDIGIFLFYFLIATVFFLILLRFSRRRGTLRIFWAITIFSGINVLFRAFLNPAFATLLAIGLVYLYWKTPTVEMHNFVLVLALPAIGALFGSQISPHTAVFILLIFSVYDVIAVYGTKHMVTMATAFMQEHVIPGIILKSTATPGVTMIHEVVPGKDFAILGSGDLVFPAVLASSAYLVQPAAGIIVAIFSVLGLFITHTIFFGQKLRRPMPALPPIALSAVIGYFITQAIF